MEWWVGPQPLGLVLPRGPHAGQQGALHMHVLVHLQQCLAVLDTYFSDILRISVCTTVKLVPRFTFTSPCGVG